MSTIREDFQPSQKAKSVSMMKAATYSTPYLKGKKIGCLRRPYLQAKIILKKAANFKIRKTDDCYNHCCFVVRRDVPRNWLISTH